MSKKYIGHDYTLSVYAENNKDNKSLVPSSSIEQQVSDQEVQISVLDSIDFSKATGSVQESGGEYSYANMIFASRSDTIGLSNRLFTHPKIGDELSADGTFGRSVVISGSTMFVNSRQRNDVGNHATRSMRSRQGVFVFKSSSSGWAFSDAIMPPSSSYPIDSSQGPQPEHVAKNFDAHSEFVAIAAPLSTEKGITLVYKSGASGYSHDATIGSASFSPAYWTQSDATDNSALIYYIANGQEGIMPSVKVNNNKLVVGGFSAAIRPDASTSFTTHHRSSSLAVFSSASSGGWVFESLLSSSVVHSASSNVGDYYRKGMGQYPGHFNGALDYDGTRVAAAGKGGYNNVTWQQDNGRVSIFKSSSTVGWYEEDQIDLRSAGFTSAVTSSLTPSSPDITLGSGVFAGSQEWKLYTKFGFYSCAISGNYMAASARSHPSLSSNSPRIKNRIFIFKSSSSGWAHEANFKSPNPGTGGDGTHSSASYADEFGYTLNFNRSVPGMLVTRSPSYRAVPDTSNSTTGRVHIYKSSSVSGWALEQNIDNPYSGSLAPLGDTDYRDDYEKFGDTAGLGSEGSGGYLDAVSTGLDGPNMAIPYSGIVESENDVGAFGVQQRFGAVQILNGSSSFRQETITQEVTESVEVTNYILSPNNLSPFIKTHSGPMNIRLQSGSSTPHSVDLGTSKS